MSRFPKVVAVVGTNASGKSALGIELAKKYNIEHECSMTLEEIRNSMVIAEGEYDPDFLTFEAPIRAMQNEEGLYRITKELVEILDEQGLIYAELRFAPQYHTQKGLSQKQAVEAAISGLQDGLKNAKQLKAQLILCAMNHCDPAHNHSENMETVHLCEDIL